MTEQKTKTLQEQAEEQLENNSLTDLLINKKQTLEEVVGAIPKTPHTIYSTNIDAINKKLDEFEKEYNGTPASTKTIHVEGVLSKFRKKVGTKLFGGEVEQEIPAIPGLQQEGIKIYESGMKTLESISENVPEIKKGIRTQENYLSKVEKYMKDHSDIFFTCKSKKKEISNLLNEFDEKLKDENLRTDEIRTVQEYIGQLSKKLTQTNQTLAEVSLRAKVYDNQIDYLKKQVGQNKDYVSMLESRLATNQSNMEMFKIQIDTLPINTLVSQSMRKMNELMGNMTKETNRMHQKYMETAEVASQLIEQNPDMNMYTDSTVNDIATQYGTFKDIKSNVEKENFDEAEKIFLKRR